MWWYATLSSDTKINSSFLVPTKIVTMDVGYIVTCLWFDVKEASSQVRARWGWVVASQLWIITSQRLIMKIQSPWHNKGDITKSLSYLRKNKSILVGGVLKRGIRLAGFTT